MVIQYFKPQQDPVALRLLKLNCFSLFHSHFFFNIDPNSDISGNAVTKPEMLQDKLVQLTHHGKP